MDDTKGSPYLAGLRNVKYFLDTDGHAWVANELNEENLPSYKNLPADAAPGMILFTAADWRVVVRPTPAKPFDELSDDELLRLLEETTSPTEDTDS